MNITSSVVAQNNEQHQDIERCKQLLNETCEQLEPAINARLNSARLGAMNSFDTQHFHFSSFFKPAVAFVMPLIIVALVMMYPTPLEEIEQYDNFYADFELLIDEDQLDFLNDLELLEWTDAS